MGSWQLWDDEPVPDVEEEGDILGVVEASVDTGKSGTASMVPAHYIWS